MFGGSREKLCFLLVLQVQEQTVDSVKPLTNPTVNVSSRQLGVECEEKRAFRSGGGGVEILEQAALNVCPFPGEE